MDIPKNVLDPKIYKKAKKKAVEKFGDKSSAYRSMYIVSQYKKMGGRYSGSKQEAKKRGVSRWIKEGWIQVIPFLESGTRVPCGSGDNTKACRPTKKMDSSTPITLQELIKIHGKKKLLELAIKKRNNMDRRINWKLGKIY